MSNSPDIAVIVLDSVQKASKELGYPPFEDYEWDPPERKVDLMATDGRILAVQTNNVAFHCPHPDVILGLVLHEMAHRQPIMSSSQKEVELFCDKMSAFDLGRMGRPCEPLVNFLFRYDRGMNHPSSFEAVPAIKQAHACGVLVRLKEKKNKQRKLKPLKFLIGASFLYVVGYLVLQDD